MSDNRCHWSLARTQEPHANQVRRCIQQFSVSTGEAAGDWCRGGSKPHATPTGWHGVTGFANYFHGEGLVGVIGLPAGITCCPFFFVGDCRCKLVVGTGNAPDAWRLGFTSFVHKADALLYTLSLEATVSDRQADLKAYGERVISCLSDQGLSTFELILWKLHCFYLCVTSY